MAKLKLFISMSLDGYLADKEDGLEWLSIVEKQGEDYGYTAFISNVKSYIIGRKTYDVVRQLLNGEFPYADKFDCYVITREQRPEENGVQFYSGDIAGLVAKLKTENAGDIYCDGGGQIVNLLLKENLIDEFIISIIPVLLGDGKRLFPSPFPQLNLELVSTQQYDTGLVQLKYQRR